MHKFLNCINRRRPVKWLNDPSFDASIFPTLLHFRITLSGEHQNRHAGIEFSDLFNHGQAVHIWHIHIGYNKLNTLIALRFF